MPTPSNVDSRLSRLETIIDNISISIEKIGERLDNHSKVNWAPIAIAVTVFFTVTGSVSTIYNSRISTINSAVEEIAKGVIQQEKNDIERRLQIQTGTQKNTQQDEDLQKIEDRLHQIETGQPAER